MNINRFIKGVNLTAKEVEEIKAIVFKIQHKTVPFALDIVFDMMANSANFQGVTVSTFTDGDNGNILFHRPK